MPSKANLVLKITGESGQAVSELEKINGKIDTLGAKAGKVGAVFKTAIAGASVGALAALTKESLSAGAELSNLTRIANAGGVEFQKYAAASRTLGIDQDKLSDIFKDTSDKIGDFLSEGGGELKFFFDEIAPKVGVTAEQFRNLSGPQSMGLYVATLKKAGVVGHELTTAMEKIASDSSALIPLFAENNKLLNEQGRLAERLGTILSDVEVQNLKDANIAVDNMQASVVNLGTKLTAALAPAITSSTNKLLELFATMASGEQSVQALEAQAASLQAQLLGSGARKNRNFIKTQIDEINEKIQIQKALGGDVAAIDAEKLRINKRLLEIDQKRADLKKGGVVGRSEVGALRGLNAESEELQGYGDQLNGITETKDEPPGVDSLIGAGATGLTKTEEDEAAKLERKIEREEKEKERTAELRAQELETIEVFAMNQEEVLANSYQRRQKMLDSHLGTSIKDQQKYDKLSIKLRSKYVDDVLRLGFFHKQTELKWDDLTAKEKLKITEHTWRSLLTGFSSSSKTLANINKAFAAKDALVNTWRGVSQSLSAYPMPIAAAMAATHLAAGMKSVSNIQGGGGGGSISSPSVPSFTGTYDQFKTDTNTRPTVPAIDSNNVVPISEEVESQREDLEPARATKHTVIIELEDGGLIGQAAMRDIAEKINELPESGVNLRVG